MPTTTNPVDELLRIEQRLPKWYISKVTNHDTPKSTVEFKPYLHQHPANTSTFTFSIPDIGISINTSPDGTYIVRGRNIPTHSFFNPDPTQLHAFLRTTTETLESDMHSRHIQQLGQRPIPSRAVNNLEQEFETYYKLLLATPEQLQQIDYIGVSTAETILTPRTPYFDQPKWCSYTCCPRCQEEFWSVFPTVDHSLNSYNQKPSLERISEITYCPHCAHHKFTPTYMMGVTEFTQRNITRFTPTNQHEYNTKLS